jgi:hypothetical protein
MCLGFGYATCSAHVQGWRTAQRRYLVSGACVLQLGVSPLEPAKKTTMACDLHLRLPCSRRMDADSQVSREGEVMFARRDRGRVYSGGVAGSRSRGFESKRKEPRHRSARVPLTFYANRFCYSSMMPSSYSMYVHERSHTVLEPNAQFPSLSRAWKHSARLYKNIEAMNGFSESHLQTTIQQLMQIHQRGPESQWSYHPAWCRGQARVPMRFDMRPSSHSLADTWHYQPLVHITASRTTTSPL